MMRSSKANEIAVFSINHVVCALNNLVYNTITMATKFRKNLLILSQ